MLIEVFKTEFKRHSLIVLAAILLPGLASAAPLVTLSMTNGAPGTTVQMPVLLMTDTTVLSARFDLLFDSKSLIVSDPVAGDALTDHMVASSQVTPGTLRVALNSFSNTQMKNGVLVFVPLTIASNAPLGIENLVLTNVALFYTNALQSITVVNGSVMVAKPAHIMTDTNGLTHGQLPGMAVK